MSEEITSAEDVLRAQLSEVYTQLEQAENNLKLSAEIGKALLEQNGKLESDYSVAMAENTNRVEVWTLGYAYCQAQMALKIRPAFFFPDIFELFHICGFPAYASFPVPSMMPQNHFYTPSSGAL